MNSSSRVGNDLSVPPDNAIESPDVNIVIVHGKLIESSQLNDYAFRGPELMPMNFVDFCVFTTQQRIGSDNWSLPHNLRSIKSLYRPQHPLSDSHYRQVSPNGSKYLPSFSGASFISADDPTERIMYISSMQLLFRRWDSWDEVMFWAQDFETSFAQFWETASPFTRSCIHNTQLQRQAREAADLAHETSENSSFIHSGSRNGVVETDEEEVDFLFHDFTSAVAPFQEKPKVLEWTQAGLHIATKAGLIPPNIGDNRFSVTSVSFSNNGVLGSDASLKTWLTDMDTSSEVAVRSGGPTSSHPSTSYVIPDLTTQNPSATSPSPSHDMHAPSVSQIRAPLNEEQRLAFDIIHEHLECTLDQATPPPAQLLMKVLGAPGTGKSKLIEMLSCLFEIRQALPLLQKTAHQGSAASIIGGSTIYSVLSLHVEKDGRKPNNNKTPENDHSPDGLTPKVLAALVERLKNVLYLFIDETSQV